MDAESLEMLARSSCTAHPQSFGGAPAESSCKHEHSHIVDSKTHGGGYAGPVSRRIFCSHCRLQRWLDVEAALALAQADVGVIPPEAALEIAKAARLSAVDLQRALADAPAGRAAKELQPQRARVRAFRRDHAGYPGHRAVPGNARCAG